MSRLDQWFRWCFNFFIFLLCFQLGMLLFLRSLYYKAEQKLKDNEASVSFSCGDFDKEESYWRIQPSLQPLHETCLDKECPESLWVGKTKNEQEEFEKMKKIMEFALIRVVRKYNISFDDFKLVVRHEPY